MGPSAGRITTGHGTEFGSISPPIFPAIASSYAVNDPAKRLTDSLRDLPEIVLAGLVVAGALLTLGIRTVGSRLAGAPRAARRA